MNFPLPAPIPGTGIVLPHVIVGDGAFPLRVDLMTPYPGHNLPEDALDHTHYARLVLLHPRDMVALSVKQQLKVANVNKLMHLYLQAADIDNFNYPST